MKEFSFKNPLESEDYYHSEEGYLIFTEQYHLKRGYCCENGCKHCPFGFRKKIDSQQENDANERSRNTKSNSVSK